MPVPPSTSYRKGLSKHLFECPLCTRLVRASQLINDINGLQVRDARLFCASCDKTFEAMPNRSRAEFLRRRFEEHYGDQQFIYALNDPFTGARRYVGRATNPKARCQQHIQHARKWSPEQSQELAASVLARRPDAAQSVERLHASKKWIVSLLEKEEKPQLEILEAVNPPVRVSEREMRWISQSIKEGDDLLNAENSTEALCRLIRGQRVDSFLTVDLDKLIRSKFPAKVEHLLYGRDTGWRRAVLIHTLYKPRPVLTTSYLTPRPFHLGKKFRKSLEKLISD
jgi:hypothetical protein